MTEYIQSCVIVKPIEYFHGDKYFYIPLYSSHRYSEVFLSQQNIFLKLSYLIYTRRSHAQYSNNLQQQIFLICIYPKSLAMGHNNSVELFPHLSFWSRVIENNSSL